MQMWLTSGTSGGGSTGLLAGVGALVVAAGFALTRAGGGKSAAPKPNKIKAKIKASVKLSQASSSHAVLRGTECPGL